MSRTRLANAFLAVSTVVLALSVPVVAADGGRHAGSDRASRDEHRPDAEARQARQERREEPEDERSRDRDKRRIVIPTPAPPSSQPAASPVPSPLATPPPRQVSPASHPLPMPEPVLMVRAVVPAHAQRVTAPPHTPSDRGPLAGAPFSAQLAFPTLGSEAAMLPLLPAGGPALLGVLMLALSAAWAEVRRRRNRALGEMLGAQLGVSPRSLDGVPPAVLRRLSSEVAFDDLTGVLRRAAGVAAVEREVQRARRSGQPLALAFIDVDGLKTVNDSQGHAAGDELLRQVTRSLKSRLRGQDMVFRYGGDEFVCVLPGATAPAAERLLEDIRAGSAAAGASFSIGIAQLEPADGAEDLVRRADEALYLRRGLRQG